jgi:cytochrome c oxidase assembly factor CtaG
VRTLFQHWTVDPFDLIVCVVIAIHARGLRLRLGAIRNANRPTRAWIQQAALFYSALLVLLIAVSSPIDYWSDAYLSFHIIQHLMLAFLAPPLIVLGAPWVPLMRGLPQPLRRALGRLLQRTRSGRAGSGGGAPTLVAVRRLFSRPLTSVALFNAAMVFWHLPGPFDAAVQNQDIHIWLEHSSFFLFGVALWLQVFGSYPLRPVLDGPRRVAALIATNAVMVVVAMTLVMFTRAIYAAYGLVHTLAQQAADQQIGGAILWVCGEITFLPAILYTVASWLDTDSSRPRGAALQPAQSETVGGRVR